MTVTERPPASRIWTAPIGLAATIWLVQVVDILLPQRLVTYGIRPRESDGLVGIVTAPFLHVNVTHLLANTGAFIILGVLVTAVSQRFWSVTAGVALISGVGVWLVAAANSVHVGASGLVYGFAAFLVAWGLLTRRLVSILVAVIVAVVYGGLVFGLVPSDSGVSWQGHLFGAVGGLIMAYQLSRRHRRDRAARDIRWTK